MIEDYILVLVGILVLLFLGEIHQVIISRFFSFCPVLYIFVASYRLFISIDEMFFYVKNIVQYLSTHFILLLNFLMSWLFPYCFVFTESFLVFWNVFWQSNSFIMLIHISWIMILTFSCKRRWWIYIPFIFEQNFYLPILSRVRLWYLFKFFHNINHFSIISKYIEMNFELFLFYYYLKVCFYVSTING